MAGADESSSDDPIIGLVNLRKRAEGQNNEGEEDGTHEEHGHSRPAELELDRYRMFPERGRRMTLADWIASPENPLTAVTVIVDEADWPALIGTGDEAEMVKSGDGGGCCTETIVVVWWLRGPLVPVTVTV